MSQIKDFGSNIKVKTADDVAFLYNACDEDGPKTGIEFESMYYAAGGDGSITTLSSEKLEEALQILATQGINTSIENVPAFLEYDAPPFPVESPALSQIEDLRNGVKSHRIVTASFGLAASPMGNLPMKRFIFSDIVNGTDPRYAASYQRYQAFSKRWLQDMPAVHDYFTGQATIQGSVTGTPDGLFDVARTALAIGPFLALLTGANPGFIDNKKIDGDPRLYQRQFMGVNAGFPDFLFGARDGEDYLQRHINHVLNHPHMMAYWDYNGTLQFLPAGEFVAFLELENKELGPCNIQNYLQAQSMSWNLLNWAPRRDGNDITGHRLEICLFNTGPTHQYATATLILKALTDKDFRAELQDLLRAHLNIDVDSKASAEFNIRALYGRAQGDRRALWQDFEDSGFTAGFIGALKYYHKDESLRPYLDTIDRIREQGPDWLVYDRNIKTNYELQKFFTKWPELTKTYPGLLAETTCVADYEIVLFPPRGPKPPQLQL